MSIYQNPIETELTPAFEIVTLDTRNGATELKDNDILFHNLGTYKIGSVVGYALENGDDPIEEYYQAVERKHELHYIFGTGASITSGNRERKRVIKVTIGMTVRFHGQLFTIETAPNDNLALKKVSNEARLCPGLVGKLTGVRKMSVETETQEEARIYIHAGRVALCLGGITRYLSPELAKKLNTELYCAARSIEDKVDYKTVELKTGN